jgi:hypothetical protein
MENKMLKKQKNRINNSRLKFERINDIELSIIFGLSVSFGWWLIDKEDVLNAKALSATFFIATILMQISIIIARFVENTFNLKSRTTNSEYHELNFQGNIDQLTLALYNSGLVLEKFKQNYYWFRTDNLIFIQSYFLVRDHKKYCTILVKAKDIKPLSHYLALNYLTNQLNNQGSN